MWAFNLDDRNYNDGDISLLYWWSGEDHLISPRHNHLYCVDDVAMIFDLLFSSHEMCPSSRNSIDDKLDNCLNLRSKIVSPGD